jgi:hypothetical protein
MNDRELIDNAAKAAKSAGMCLLYGGSTDEAESYWHYDFRRWNPLTDDGDALRLAHALGMQLNLDECNDMNDVRTDIVMAAAAIGAAL